MGGYLGSGAGVLEEGAGAGGGTRLAPTGSVADPWCTLSSSPPSSSPASSLILSADPNLFLMRWAISLGLLITVLEENGQGGLSAALATALRFRAKEVRSTA